MGCWLKEKFSLIKAFVAREGFTGAFIMVRTFNSIYTAGSVARQNTTVCVM